VTLTTVNTKKQAPKGETGNLGCTRVTSNENNPKVRVGDHSTGIRKTSPLRSWQRASACFVVR